MRVHIICECAALNQLRLMISLIKTLHPSSQQRVLNTSDRVCGQNVFTPVEDKCPLHPPGLINPQKKRIRSKDNMVTTVDLMLKAAALICRYLIHFHIWQQL